MADMRLRSARSAEAGALSEMAQRSKAHWGYAATFLEACRPGLTFSEDKVRQGRFVLAEQRVPTQTHGPDTRDGRNARIGGFYELVGDPPEFELSNLWVDPDSIGTGIGRMLWTHAMNAARELGGTTVMIEADPNALGFYQAMGAIQVGEAPSSSIPGRLLPLLRFVL
jgi:ribosomal protein S18 acetylase RimI-like enzyme